MDRMDRFEEELRDLINRHSVESDSNTPDFVLAQYLRASLEAYNAATRRRGKWYRLPCFLDPPPAPAPQLHHHQSTTDDHGTVTNKG